MPSFNPELPEYEPSPERERLGEAASMSYDGDKAPKPSREVIAEATSVGLRPITVHCFEQGSAGLSTADGFVSFVAFVNFIPQRGDCIYLEDGSACEVKRVSHQVLGVPPNGLITMDPLIIAVRVQGKAEGRPEKA